MLEIGTFQKEVWVGDNLFNVYGEVVKGDKERRYQADGGYPGTPDEIVIYDVNVDDGDGDEVEVYDKKRNVDKLNLYDTDVDTIIDYTYEEL